MTDALTFVISEPLCEAYCKLLQHDFPLSSVRKNFLEETPESTDVDIESKLAPFYDGLANNRLELAGSMEDVCGWLYCYVEAYIDPVEPEGPFHDWDGLSAAEQQAVRDDAARLSPILHSF